MFYVKLLFLHTCFDIQSCFKHKQYIGSLGATYPEQDFEMYLRWHKEGKFPLNKLVTDRYTLEDIAIACDDLHSGKITGRAIVEF